MTPELKIVCAMATAAGTLTGIMCILAAISLAVAKEYKTSTAFTGLAFLDAIALLILTSAL